MTCFFPPSICFFLSFFTFFVAGENVDVIPIFFYIILIFPEDSLSTKSITFDCNINSHFSVLFVTDIRVNLINLEFLYGITFLCKYRLSTCAHRSSFVHRYTHTYVRIIEEGSRKHLFCRIFRYLPIIMLTRKNNIPLNLNLSFLFFLFFHFLFDYSLVKTTVN